MLIGNDFYEKQELELERGMDRAEAYIVKNYTLNTEYDVVYVINHFVASQLDYGKGTNNNHPYLIGNMNTTCTGYTDFASRLYNRFGIESRLVRGDAPNGSHAWNEIKVSGKWYYADATFTDNVKFSEKHVLFTQDFRDKEGFKNYRSTFRVTNDTFDKIKSVAYNYKAVKAAQAKK